MHGFLIDWLEVQRAVGRFVLLMTPEDQQQVINDLAAYIAREKAAAAPAPN